MDRHRYRVRVQICLTTRIYKIEEYFLYAENEESAIKEVGDTLKRMRENGLINYHHDFFILSADCF